MMTKKKMNLLASMRTKGSGSEVMHRLMRRPMAVIALIYCVLIVLVAIFADVLADYETLAIAINSSIKQQGPSWSHLLGTDQYGRDMLARIIHGARTALLMGVVSAAITQVIAVILSAVGSIYGGIVDNIIMRIMDILSSLPGLVIALAICAGLGQGLWQLIVALTVQGIPYQTRLMRSRALGVAQMEYVEAARALGAKNGHNILHHFTPNMASIMIVSCTSNVSYNILMGTTLSFVGLGVAAPRPEWGMMLNEGMTYMSRYPHLIIIPGVALVLTALFINTLGDCLRDAFDPQLKGKA